MKRRSKVSGDLGGRSFLAYGSIRPWWKIFTAYGGEAVVPVYTRGPYSVVALVSGTHRQGPIYYRKPLL